MIEKLLTHDYFPLPAEKLPFGEFLNGIFFNPIGDNLDYPIHGPNVIRLLKGLLHLGANPPAEGLFRGELGASVDLFLEYNRDIAHGLGVDPQNPRHKIVDLLCVAALYHDTGKYIRRANHPQIGGNLLRNDQPEQLKLVELLQFDDDIHLDSRHNRFSLITSIVQHHDKFGVVSTGEGGLPIFSDILYFTSDQKSIAGIIKNVTSVMLLNLADIAAVNTASKSVKDLSLEISAKIRDLRKLNFGKRDDKSYLKEEANYLKQLTEYCKQPSSCLGLDTIKLKNVLEDWSTLVDAIKDKSVEGNRVYLKHFLLSLEKNPSRVIGRVIRLLEESAVTANCKDLLNIKYISPTSVESVLVGTLGAHQFQWFCEQFSTIVKLDYGLNFFKAILCASVRKSIYQGYSVEWNEKSNLAWNKLSDQELSLMKALPDLEKSELATKITVLFVKVLEALVSRYSGVFNYSQTTPRRFGVQMRDLTLDSKIRDSIIDLLCIKDTKDSVALTWMVDEVTIWSFD